MTGQQGGAPPGLPEQRFLEEDGAVSGGPRAFGEHCSLGGGWELPAPWLRGMGHTGWLAEPLGRPRQGVGEAAGLTADSTCTQAAPVTTPTRRKAQGQECHPSVPAGTRHLLPGRLLKEETSYQNRNSFPYQKTKKNNVGRPLCGAVEKNPTRAEGEVTEAAWTPWCCGCGVDQLLQLR